jgi:integrase
MALNTKMIAAALAGKHSFPAGRHAVPNSTGLYLVVSPTGAMSWAFMFKKGGKRQLHGLGSLTGKGAAVSVSLDDARKKANKLRDQIAEGKDLRAEKENAKVSSEATFAVFLEETLKSRNASDAHKKQWKRSLTNHAASIMQLPVNAITIHHVRAVLDPIWPSKLGEDVRHRVEKVLKVAKKLGQRQGMDNPADWENLEDVMLPKWTKAESLQNSHASLPYFMLPAFMDKLLAFDGLSARALAFAILTATRSSEAREARWSEMNDDLTIWSIPAARMKGKKNQRKPHFVPLSAQASALLRAVRKRADSDFVFANHDGSAAINDKALGQKLVEMKLMVEATVHGFRSTFANYVTDNLLGHGFTEEDREQCLAHSLKAVTAAYTRTDVFAKRAKIMQAWADHATGATQASNVVELKVERVKLEEAA